MKSVIIFEPQDFSFKVVEILSKHGFDVFLNFDNISMTDALERFTIIYMRLGVYINNELINKCDSIKCKFIVIPATGIDHVDIPACNRNGIKVISFKNKTHLLKDIRATAELTIALTLNLLRNIIPAVENTKSGNWNRDLFRGKDIYGKRVGIIGFGRLGSIVANYFHNFGAIVQVYDKDMIEIPSEYNRATYLDDIFLTNEIISLHVDYNEDNIEMINLDKFRLTKNNPIFINTSRGQLVNEEDLIFALKNNLISGAALDVVYDELNLKYNNKLISYSNNNNNLIITPHIGGCTIDSSQKTEEIITYELLDIIKKNI
jgi:D-3-phosphoglycerate dehydrogenase